MQCLFGKKASERFRSGVCILNVSSKKFNVTYNNIYVPFNRLLRRVAGGSVASWLPFASPLLVSLFDRFFGGGGGGGTCGGGGGGGGGS